MSKKIILLPLISLLFLTGLNISSQAQARHNQGHERMERENSRHFDRGRDRNEDWGRHDRGRWQPNVVYIRPEPVIINEYPEIDYGPGSYYFNNRDHAYYCYRRAITFGFSPSIYLSNGRWTLIIR